MVTYGTEGYSLGVFAVSGSSLLCCALVWDLAEHGKWEHGQLTP